MADLRSMGVSLSRETTPDNAVTPPNTTPSPGPSASEYRKTPSGLSEPGRPKPLTSTYLNRNYHETDKELIFQNMDEAMASMKPPQWLAPANDETMPKTDAEDRAVVTKLIDAFKDMSTAKDTLGNAYRKRLTPGEDVYYKDWAVEACAWDILRMVKIVHTEGFRIPIYDRAILDMIGQTQLWTFQERIDWICLVLKTSKNVAVTLMKHEKVWTTIGAPHKLYNSTLVNFVSNGNRNEWVKAGRKADENHQNRPKRRKIDYGDTSTDLAAAVKKPRKTKISIKVLPDLPVRREDVSDDNSNKTAEATTNAAATATTTSKTAAIPSGSAASAPILIDDDSPVKTTATLPKQLSHRDVTNGQGLITKENIKNVSGSIKENSTAIVSAKHEDHNNGGPVSNVSTSALQNLPANMPKHKPANNASQKSVAKDLTTTAHKAPDQPKSDVRNADELDVALTLAGMFTR